MYSGCTGSDISLISEFADFNAEPLEGYYTDFTGIRTSTSAFPNIQNSSGVVNRSLPFPMDFHATAVEYASLYYAVKQLRKQRVFTMFELGAGWGPWMAYAAKACIKGGYKQVNILGVEGETNKIPLIKEHLYVNGMRENSNELLQCYNNINSHIIHGVVTEKDCIVEFPIVDVMDYGATMLNSQHTKGSKMVSIPGYSFKSLMKDFEFIDYVHMDIQGHELDVIKSSIVDIEEKVRYLCIGTHSRKIEGDLVELLWGKWELLREMPCLFNKGILPNDVHLIDLTTRDGTQFWRNPKI